MICLFPGEEALGHGTHGPGKPNIINPGVSLSNGQLYKLEFKFENSINISAYQLEFKIDTSKIAVISCSLPLANAFGDSTDLYFEGDNLKTYWYNSTGDSTTITNSEKLLSMTIMPKMNLANTSILALTNELSESAIYAPNGTSLNENITMTKTLVNGHKINTQINLNGKSIIYPNPTLDGIGINFYLPEEQNVQLFIFDMAGKLKIQKEYRLGVGNQNFEINEVRYFENGTYLAIVKSKDTNYTELFVKQ